MENKISTINTKKNINSKLPVNNPKTNSDKISQQPVKDSYFNQKTIIGSLFGLALLGTSTFLCIKHFRKPKVQNSKTKIDAKHLKLEIKNIKERINYLKNLVKVNYVEQRNHLYKNNTNLDEYSVDINFTNFNDLKSEIKTLRRNNNGKINKINEIINKNRQIVIEKLKNLSSNKEWNDIKKLRKQTRKIIETSTNEEQKKIAQEKMPLINDLIYNRVYPENIENYKNLYGIEDKNVLELVKKEFSSYEEFMKAFDSLKNPTEKFDYTIIEERISSTGPLTLKDVFPKEIDTIDSNLKLKKEYETQLKEYEKIYRIILDKLVELAKKYRNCSEIKELKNLTVQLKTKEAQLNNLEG